MEILDLEDKEFNLKFSCVNLLRTFMFLEKILLIYPNADDPAFKDCSELRDSRYKISYLKKNIDKINTKILFNAVNLENTFESN